MSSSSIRTGKVGSVSGVGTTVSFKPQGRSAPLHPPSVENLLLLVKLAGGDYHWRADMMMFRILMPIPRLNLFKAIELGHTDLARYEVQDYVKQFISECLKESIGETNG